MIIVSAFLDLSINVRISCIDVTVKSVAIWRVCLFLLFAHNPLSAGIGKYTKTFFFYSAIPDWLLDCGLIIKIWLVAIQPIEYLINVNFIILVNDRFDHVPTVSLLHTSRYMDI